MAVDDFTTQDMSYLFAKKVGIYLLYKDEVCLYVGQSKDIFSRISEHRKASRIRFNWVLIRECDKEELDHLEFLFVRKFQPALNKAHSGPTL